MDEQYWIFTFGCGQLHGGCAIRIKGSYGEARDKMCEKYGINWGFQYSEKEWERMKNDPDRRWLMETIIETIE